MPTLETIYLMICVTFGFDVPGDVPLCVTYHLRPQHEISQEVVNKHIGAICALSRKRAIQEGGYVTKCELVSEDYYPNPDTLPPVEPPPITTEDLRTSI